MSCREYLWAMRGVVLLTPSSLNQGWEEAGRARKLILGWPEVRGFWVPGLCRYLMLTLFLMGLLHCPCDGLSWDMEEGLSFPSCFFSSASAFLGVYSILSLCSSFIAYPGPLGPDSEWFQANAALNLIHRKQLMWPLCGQTLDAQADPCFPSPLLAIATVHFSLPRPELDTGPLCPQNKNPGLQVISLKVSFRMK